VNWINKLVRPKISRILRKREMPDNLWIKCPETGQMIYYKDLQANQFVVPTSNYHMRMDARARLETLFDEGRYETIEFPEVSPDPLKFRDERRYTERLKDARAKTGMKDAILAGQGTLDGLTVVAAVQDFRFLGGSLGRAAGDAMITAMRAAVEAATPFILFAASGGARMQEGILSLMQMPRTTIAVEELNEARLPYIVVFTNPTTGGVTASYAMLGDIHIAEPGALIGFAGPRVIEQTIREKLPMNFQRSEYLLEHGMVDMVVHRHELRPTLSRLCRMLMNQPMAEHPALGETEEAPLHEQAPLPGEAAAAPDEEPALEALEDEVTVVNNAESPLEPHGQILEANNVGHGEDEAPHDAPGAAEQADEDDLRRSPEGD